MEWFEQLIWHFHCSGVKKDEGTSTHTLQLELDEFIVCQKPVELLGEESKLCEIPITLESTELPTEDTKRFQVRYLLFRYYKCIFPFMG